MKHYKKIDKTFLNDCGYETKHNKNEYIVIHYTAGANDSAEAVAKYFVNLRKRNFWVGDRFRYASAHFVVDEKSIFQCVDSKLTAWHCGDNKYIYSKGGSLFGKCTNYNSVGIEMCKQLDKLNFATIENSIHLTKRLMKKYKINAKNVIRHYDVSGKHCPAKMIDDTIEYKNNWNIFKKCIALSDNFEIKIENDGTCLKREIGKTKWIKIGQFKN